MSDQTPEQRALAALELYEAERRSSEAALALAKAAESTIANIALELGYDGPADPEYLGCHIRQLMRERREVTSKYMDLRARFERLRSQLVPLAATMVSVFDDGRDAVAEKCAEAAKQAVFGTLNERVGAKGYRP